VFKNRAKDEVVSVLKQCTMKTYGGSECKKFHAFLTLATHGGEWTVSCPGHFTPPPLPREKIFPYPLNSSLSGPQSQSQHTGKETHICPC